MYLSCCFARFDGYFLSFGKLRLAICRAVWPQLIGSSELSNVKNCDLCAVVASVAGRCSAWKFANSSQTSEASAKVTVQNGWPVPQWLSLEFGTSVQIEGTVVVRYPTPPWCWISLLDGCGFLRAMGISTSTLSDAPTLCGLQPALDRQCGDTLLHDFFGLHNSCRATFFHLL